MSNLENLIKELQIISPMPDDDKITYEVLIKYGNLLMKISKFNNPLFIEPLINSFGYGEGNGIYWNQM